MTALYPDKADTLTARNIIDAYRSAYITATDHPPAECWHSHGNTFVINGVERERAWVILEIERLRQEALAKAFEPERNQSNSNSARGSIFKLIRRLSRL